MIRLSVRWLVTIAAVAAMAFAAQSSAQTPRAHVAGSCSVGSGRGFGYSYLTSLWVYKVTCATGRSVAKAHGHKRGWSCHRKLLDRSRTQYDARETCDASRKRQIQWTYTQNT